MLLCPQGTFKIYIYSQSITGNSSTSVFSQGALFFLRDSALYSNGMNDTLVALSLVAEA